MNRYEFLKSMGFRGGALMALLTSCIREEDTYVEALTISPSSNTTPVETTPPTTGTTDLSTIKNPLVTIDLTASANAALKTVGGYLVKSGIVIAQASAGVYVAATQTCSHEPKKRVIFNKTEFYCTDHGARFDLTGKGLNSFGSKGIAVYKVATDGKTLVVYS
ncbi:Rieske 2Fe-2S domain-containing protein [Runella sp. MFBS21]|uniref:Rieske (2Fe-2S) protein n=1 Tax=Runella sp. MFBS21 TaxID=3034018 RepID=UPI0023F82648|nr:Rieske 2Fe-2S domain-containing protein [Runella sp. MFBS21]MDF7816959.1 Rieske 2Fe-2S domain-containing protein [Runella sp. MFBS21]